MNIKRDGKKLTFFPGDFNEESVYCFHAKEAAIFEHAEEMYSSLYMLVEEAEAAGVRCDGYRKLFEKIDQAS